VKKEQEKAEKAASDAAPNASLLPSGAFGACKKLAKLHSTHQTQKQCSLGVRRKSVSVSVDSRK
jgi:hypothetical protein